MCAEKMLSGTQTELLKKMLAESFADKQALYKRSSIFSPLKKKQGYNGQLPLLPWQMVVGSWPWQRQATWVDSVCIFFFVQTIVHWPAIGLVPADGGDTHPRTNRSCQWGWVRIRDQKPGCLIRA
jgi:hypothetical protein